MIAIPLTRKISWRNPPIFTIAIILVNVFVFFVYQRDDRSHYVEAAKFYFESGLDAIEIPIYLEFLKNHRPKAFEELPVSNPRKGTPEWRQVCRQVDYDRLFMEKVAKGEITIDDFLQQRRWRSLREDYEDIRRQIVSLQYGFRPARPRIETLFTSIFLHGGVGHLVGNMIFLWLIGCMIEYGCRRYLFVVIYGLGGVSATGLFWLLNSHSLVPLIGASGAISGIMGAFTVLYGLKSVRIFLSLGFYFNYLKFPAIVMLPLWVGNELWQMLTQQGSQIAYAAHLGGLVGGAAIAFFALRIPGCLDLEGFEAVQDDPVGPMLEKALAHMGKLEFHEARELLLAADELKPDDEVILQHLFTIDRQEPERPRFHRTGQKLMNHLCRQPYTYEKAYEIYRQYIKLARPAKLGAAMYLRLSQVFCEIGQLQDAQRLVAMLIKQCPQLEDLPSLLIKLATAHSKIGNRKAGYSCLTSLCKLYPQSPEAHIARRQLRTIADQR